MAGIKSRTLAACCGDSGKGEPLNRENLADAIGQWFPPGGYRALFRRNFEIQDPPVYLLPPLRVSRRLLLLGLMAEQDRQSV